MDARAGAQALGAVRWIGAVLVALFAAGASLARVLLTNPDALNTLLFAEDGIFPLCVVKADPFTCLVDPYAGYLLALPRLVAVPIAYLPLESWTLWANLAAAIAAGVLALVAFLALVRWGLSPYWSVVVAVLPVVMPIVGLEAINVYASLYMPLLFTMSIVVVTWTDSRRTWWAAIGLLLAALTIPSAVVLFVPLVILVWRRRMALRDGAVLAGALGLGLVAQLFTVLSAENPRPVSVSWESLSVWADNIPVAITTLWPGLSFGPGQVFGFFPIPVQTATGWLVALLLTIGGLWLAVRRSDHGMAVGLLLVLGVGLGAIPTIIGFASNRYYVLSVLLWMAAALLALAGLDWKRPVLVWGVTVALLVFAWWPAFPASEWRATATPAWPTQVAAVTEACSSDPGAVVEVLFTPDWPMPHVEVTEPTTNRLPCLALGLWRQ